MDSSNLDDDSLSAQIKEILYSGADSLDFNAAISLGEAVLPAVQQGPERYKLLECLALCLCRRYETRNEWNDIERAIEYLQEAYEEEDDSIRVAGICQIYARCLRNRFMRGKSPEEIENAILFAEKSVSISKTLYARDDGTKKLLVKRLGELSMCYFAKAYVLDKDECPDAADAFDLAISRANEARDLLGQEITNTPEGFELLSSLAMYSQVKFDQDPGQYLQSLMEAIDIGRLVLQYEYLDPESKMQACSNLALYIFRLVRHYLDNLGDYSEDEGWKCLEETVSLMHQSLSIEEASPVNRLFNTITLVLDIPKLSAERHQREALRQIDKLLRIAVDLLSRTVLTAAQYDQRDLLAKLYGLARYATAAALENGADPFEAMRLLEKGRTVILSTRMEPVEELAFLKAHNNELAERYSAVWKEMRAAAFLTKPLEDRLELMEELDAVKSCIQEEVGFFDQRWDKEAMMKLAEEGPIIAINITDIRSDALIILHNDIFTLPLIALKDEWLSEKSWEIQSRLAQGGSEKAAEVAGDLHDLMLDALKELWKRVVKPILKSLGYTTVLAIPPRVWWIPTGVLTLFPLHAAGNLTTNNNTMKYVVSSYTPSLKLLKRSRQKLAGINPDSTANQEAAEGAVTGSALVLMMEDTPNHDPLPKSHAEAAAVQKTFPNAKVLSGPTREEALEYLQQCPQVVHFSCHGEVIYEDPLQSQILLAEAPLTVSDLQELQLQGSHLAFLSLCFAAHAGIERDQDEIIHIASAFQIAGFASVLAAMWYVSEDIALQVAEHFYEYFRKRRQFEMKETARALHEAVLQLRESTRNTFNDNKGAPIIWSPFVHFGV